MSLGFAAIGPDLLHLTLPRRTSASVTLLYTIATQPCLVFRTYPAAQHLYCTLAPLGLMHIVHLLQRLLLRFFYVFFILFISV